MWYREKQSNTKENINVRVKEILKNHPFFKILMDYYGVDYNDIDNHLDINIKKMDGKYSEGNGEEINLNEKLFNEDNLLNNFHFIVHEFFHWIKRRAEDKFYFNDPEEVQSFVIAMTWELIRGKSKEDIKRFFAPIVFKYFTDKSKAQDTLEQMIEKSENLKNMYQKKCDLNG